MAKISIKIFADVKALKDSLAGAEDELVSFRDRVNGMGKKMMQVGAGMTAGLTVPIIGMGKSFVDAASDMAETSSKVQTLFGDQAAEIEAWAETSATSFGQSKKAALDAAGTFGNMFMQLGIGTTEAAGMSKNITELASDFASFHNTSPEEAILAIGAAFRGEFDSVQKYVPTITAAAVEQKALQMGLKRSTGELTAQDKALATNALLFEGAGDAVGDFDRTAGGAANTQRTLGAEFANLRAELGEKLLPVYQRLQELVKGLIDWFSGLTDGQQKLILIFGGVVAILGPLVLLMGALATAVTAVSWPVLAIIAAIALLTAGVIYAYKNWEWFHDAVDAIGRFFRDKFIPVMKELWAWFQEKIVPILEKVAGFVRDVFAHVWDNVSKTFTEVVIPAVKLLWSWFQDYLWPVIQQVWDIAGQLAGVMRDVLSAAFDRARDAASGVADFFQRLWDKTEPLREIMGDLAGVVKDKLVGAFDAVKEIVQKVIDKIGDVISKAEKAISKVKELFTGTAEGNIGRGIGAPSSSAGTTIRARAMGGPVSGGSPYLVGEVGPELFVPGRSGTIVPNHALGGGSTVVNVYAMSANPQEVVNAVRQYTRDNGASWMTSVA